MKNENATLTQHLEELLRKLQHLEDKETKEQEGVAKLGREEEKVVRGVQGSETLRGEGEGRVRMMVEREKRGETMGTRREAGVGEEGLHVPGWRGEICDDEMEIKSRGEAEGGQKEVDKRDKESEPKLETSRPEHLKPLEETSDTAHLSVCSPSTPDVELLTSRLQKSQEEADLQAGLVQELRLKLVEQSRRTWEAEQKLLLVEAELQRLKKAAESLVEARRQIEVRMDKHPVLF